MVGALPQQNTAYTARYTTSHYEASPSTCPLQRCSGRNGVGLLPDPSLSPERNLFRETRIHVTAGNGANVEWVSQYPGEAERLLPSNVLLIPKKISHRFGLEKEIAELSGTQVCVNLPRPTNFL